MFVGGSVRFVTFWSGVNDVLREGVVAKHSRIKFRKRRTLSIFNTYSLLDVKEYFT